MGEILSSFKPPGASYTAQGRQKQLEIIKNILFGFHLFLFVFVEYFHLLSL